ncbi:MAG: sugar ABC transporter permease [Anaerovoracaceae bacterium]|nr:sugar ABC transporter permease [Anaerovoracaceae bacterium]
MNKRNKAVIIYKKPYLIFLIPSLVGIAVFYIIPYCDIFRRAFFATSGKEFVGLGNFTDIITNEAFLLAIRNTGRFVVVCIPLLLILSFAIALYIYNRLSENTLLKTMFLAPMAIPVATVVLFWKILFQKQGLLNALLAALDINTIDWMNTGYAFWILVLSYVWKNLGYHIILWIAGLSMIPNNLYEAARIDGAESRQIFFRITLPNLKPMIFVVVVLALLNSFKVFREAYLVAGNYPNESMYLIQHLFNNWFRDLSLDKMAAASFLISIVLILLIFALRKAWDSKNEK